MASTYRQAMKLTSHLTLSAPFAGIITWQAGPMAAAVFSAGAILIDIDHFIFYALRTGRYNPAEMFTWYETSDRQCTQESYYGLSIFHAAEIFVLLSLATSFVPIISWLLLGMGFHLLLDYIWLYRHPVLSMKVRPLSWTEHLVRRLRGEREFWRDNSRQ
jgi:hypothetical protein